MTPDKRAAAVMTPRPTAQPIVRPERPDFVDDWPFPRQGFFSFLRHGVKRLVNATVDKGWFGLHPLRTHVVLCGFQRSGSTLLQLIVETCVSDIRTFGTEYWAPAAVHYAFRNHPFMVTKAPQDIFCVDEVRAFYASRAVDPKFVVTIRDPRSVLTSVHVIPSQSPDGYFVEPKRWLAYYQHVRYAQQFGDVQTVEYNDLIARPADIQARLTEFIGWRVHLPFEQFHSEASPRFDQRGLNGLRPLESSRVDAWRQECHRERICRILRELPDLPEYLIEMGYESDTSWARNYV
jgi:hypothetical protein